jgi:aldehyde:ferredoxin oxidoreductase
MFEFFGIMRLVQSLAEEGVIPKGEADPPVSLSSLNSLETWARKITSREGLGEVLAGGFNGVIQAFGERAARLAPPLVKGMHPYAGPGAAVDWDLFGTMELGQVLDPRGPHVGASGSPTYFARRPVEVFPKHLNRMGVPEDAFQRILPGLVSPEGHQDIRVGRLLKYSHRWFTTLGSLGICARAAVNRFYSAALCVQLYGAVTGFETDLPGFMKKVDRVWTLLRLASLREGMERKTHEALPWKWFDAHGFKEYATEQPLDREGAERMIEDYYEEWGWDREKGVPTARTLEELGLQGLEA